MIDAKQERALYRRAWLHLRGCAAGAPNFDEWEDLFDVVEQHHLALIDLLETTQTAPRHGTQGEPAAGTPVRPHETPGRAPLRKRHLELVRAVYDGENVA